MQQQNILSEFIKKSEEGSCAIQIKKEDISKIEGFQEFLNDLGQTDLSVLQNNPQFLPNNDQF